ncbi:hypothetical protein [Streptomyces mirabilis]|uniref:hypothetical protein n=1 Tax=Streptomyces mirabilis TaxID=68239 RepID=UPI0033C4F91C
MPDPSTTRLALYKSKSDGSELVNYPNDLGGNWDKVDLAVGYQVVTSSTRPATPYPGKPIAQSDTAYSTFFSNGTSPASASWVEIPNSSSTFGSNLKLASGVQLLIGADTNLYRSAANVLKTDDAFVTVGNVTVGGDLKLVNGTTTYRNQLSAQTTVANTVTETVIASMTVPANDAAVGAVYRIKAWGTVSAAAATTPTMNWKWKIGGTGGYQMAQSQNRTAGAAGASTRAWQCVGEVVCLATGASGSFQGSLLTTEGWSVTGGPPIVSPATILDGTTPGTRDSTASQQICLTATWGTANAANTLTCLGYYAERIA